MLAQVSDLPLPWKSQLPNAVKRQATPPISPPPPTQEPAQSTIASSYCLQQIAHVGQGTQRPDLAGSFPPTEPRFPGPRSSPPGRQQPTRHHATDCSCGVRGVNGIRTGARRRTPTRLPFLNTQFPRPHHGGRSTLGGRVPLPDPVGPAQGFLMGQRSKESGASLGRNNQAD